MSVKELLANQPKDVQIRYGRLSRLKPYRNHTPEQLLAVTLAGMPSVAPLSASAQIDITSKFQSAAEKKLAQQLVDRYLHDYQIDTVADRNTLAEVIYYEVLQMRMQDKLNDLYSNNVKAVPFDMVGVMHKTSEILIKLKSTLGLNKAKEQALHGYDAYEHLRKRHRKWLEQNQASRTCKCPHCSKFILLKMRMEAWAVQKHPFFQDNMVYNRHLFSVRGQTVTIDDKFIADVLETSPDYVGRMVELSKNTDTVTTDATVSDT